MTIFRSKKFYHIPLTINDNELIWENGNISSIDDPAKTTINFDEHVLIIKDQDESCYLINPYHIDIASDQGEFRYLLLPKKDYAKKLENKEIIPNFNDEAECAFAVGWADFAWLSSGELINGLATAILSAGTASYIVYAAATMYPFLLGYLVYHVTLKKLIERYKYDHNMEPPSPEELAKIKQEASAAAWKMTAGVAGWTVGYFLYEKLLQSLLFSKDAGIFLSPGGIAAHVFAALLVGFCAAMTTGLAIYYLRKKENPTLTERDWLIIFLGAFCAFIGGALWWICYNLPGFTHLANAIGGPENPGGYTAGEILGVFLSSCLVLVSGVGVAYCFSNQQQFDCTMTEKNSTSTLVRWLNKSPQMSTETPPIISIDKKEEEPTPPTLHQ